MTTLKERSTILKNERRMTIRMKMKRLHFNWIMCFALEDEYLPLAYSCQRCIHTSLGLTVEEEKKQIPLRYSSA